MLTRRIMLWLVSVCLPVFLALTNPINQLGNFALAQSTAADTLPGAATPTATLTPPAPLVSPATATSVPLSGADVVWQARLVQVEANATLGGGAVVRVYVDGRAETPLLMQQDDVTLRNITGSKAEYGPFAAEFAPVPAGAWWVIVPDVGVNFPLQTDNNSLFVVEFKGIPAAEATAIARTSATPTPIGGQLWRGDVINRSDGPNAASALLRVQVQGQTGLPVEIKTLTDPLGTGITGHKPDDLPADVVEFAGLAPGDYVLIPQGLGVELVVNLAANSTVNVLFKPIPPPTPTLTPTPLPPTPRPPTATPTPTPQVTWQGRIVDRVQTGGKTATLNVVTVGRRGATLQLLTTAGEVITGCTTGEPGAPVRSACRLDDLTPGRYQLSWDEAPPPLPLELGAGETVTLEYAARVINPAEPMTWHGALLAGSSAFPTTASEATLHITVDAPPGQVVQLTNGRGETRLTTTDFEQRAGFGQLAAGVYQISLPALTAEFWVYLDGRRDATVRFEAVPGAVVTTGVAVMGMDARPKSSQTGLGARPATGTPTPTPSATLTPTATSRPTRTATPAPTITATVGRPSPPTVMPSPSATLTPSPEPERVWQGVVAENFTHPGQTLVVQAPFDRHPLIVSSGAWQLSGETNTKPELGEGAAEFVGLAPGEYTIELVGLGTTTVDLGVDQFVRVVFVYEYPPTPTPTPPPGAWTGAVLENTSGTETGGGAWSILTVKVGGMPNLPITIHTEGVDLTCQTGSKPELPADECRLGGLGPSTYTIKPAGVPYSVTLELDGRGAAYVAFWQQ